MLTELGNETNPSVLPIVPMKPLSQCKTRLERVMGTQDRADLTIGMLRRVLLAIRGAGVDPFWVIGGDDRIRNISRTLGATWMEDLGRNLNDTITKAFENGPDARGVSAVPAGRPAVHQAGGHPPTDPAARSTSTTSRCRRRGGTGVPTRSWCPTT